jgi:signal transduction histidine kinase
MPSRAASLVDLVLHELRTPLTVAIGSLRQVGTLADPVQQAAVARALRSCERLEQLASQMRDWTRLEDAPAEPSALPLAPALAEAVGTASTTRVTAIALAGEHHDVLVRGLPHLLPGALASLLSAVVRAADASETIALEVTVADGTASLVVRRPEATRGHGTETFEAEWLGGLGFSLPLARAVIVAGGGDVTSGHAPDGRLQWINVRLAVAAAPTSR